MPPRRVASLPWLRQPAPPIPTFDLPVRRKRREPSRLLLLPLEIRELIWFYALTPIEGHYEPAPGDWELYDPQSIYATPRNPNPWSEDPPYWGTEQMTRLLRVASRIHAEAVDVLYKRFFFPLGNGDAQVIAPARRPWQCTAVNYTSERLGAKSCALVASAGIGTFMLNQHGFNRRYGAPGSTAPALIRRVAERFTGLRNIVISVGFFDWSIYTVPFVKSVVQHEFGVFRRVPRVQFRHVSDPIQEKHRHVFELALAELSLEFTAAGGEEEEGKERERPKRRVLRSTASTPVLKEGRRGNARLLGGRSMFGQLQEA